MKTYVSDIIPKIQKFSLKLDNLTLLINQHWIIIDDIEDAKNVYIFRRNNELLISNNGKVEKAKWEYLGSNSLLVEKKDEIYLFKQVFFDKNILALKVDSIKNEYVLMINELMFNENLRISESILNFLSLKYLQTQRENCRMERIGYKDNSLKSENLKSTNPQYDIINKSAKYSWWGNIIELYEIKYDDGEIGMLYFNHKKTQSFFKDTKSLAWTTWVHYYDGLEAGINALHYFLKTGNIMNKGYIATY